MNFSKEELQFNFVKKVWKNLTLEDFQEMRANQKRLRAERDKLKEKVNELLRWKMYVKRKHCVSFEFPRHN